MTIRPYAPDDMIPAVGLWYRAWHESHPGERHVFPIEVWRQRWVEGVVPSAEIHVAVIDSGMVGYVAVALERPWLSHVVVTPKYRRRGIGRRLIDAAKLASPSGLTFYVSEINSAAQSFYASCGFAPGETVDQLQTRKRMVPYT